MAVYRQKEDTDLSCVSQTWTVGYSEQPGEKKNQKIKR